MIEGAFEKIGGGWNRLVMNRRNWWLTWHWRLG